ncbi:hypothetical protein DY000_02042328 [Brassica cretica]|uniref:C2 domain-containing protein n=1 Tax=Brassica cretica TaxID=69181 RepID=A0ABQ7B5D9_BRACR|nr:hypothetical protein DY000_02042328 [Brassica cretica]
MIPQSSTFDFVSHANVSRRLFCPSCSNAHGLIVFSDGFSRWKTRVHVTNASSKKVATAPWVGAASWAFVPFRLFNLMGSARVIAHIVFFILHECFGMITSGIPVLSMFLTKLLTEDLPRLIVRPKKIVLDFQKGKAVGPISEDLKSGDFVGELSVTLVNAQKLPYMFSGRTDPYVILRMGDQVIRSKKNSQNSIGAPGQPIWNQDFQFLVSNPREQVLQIEVNDCLGFADMAIGTGHVDLGSLPDTVPKDRVVVLRGGWSLFGKGSAGELLLRAYIQSIRGG